MDTQQERRKSDRRLCVARWLGHVRTLQAECRSLERMIAAERERIDGMKCALGSESVSGGLQKEMADTFARMTELTERWGEQSKEAAAFIAHAMEATHSGSIPRLACWLHWGEGLLWREVASELGYSEEHARNKLASQGVDELWPSAPFEFKQTEPV